MNDQQAKIKKGPAKRSPVSLRLERDIVIPKGTILRQAATQRGGIGYVETPIGHGKDFTSFLVVQDHLDATLSGDFTRVMVA